MSAANDFLSRFDPGGRFRDSDGSLEVVFLTNQGGKYPGRLAFRGGLCVSSVIDDGSKWSYPDGSPLNGLRFLLHFEGQDPLEVIVREGRILTRPALQAELRSRGDADLSTADIDKFLIHQRAHTTLLSLSSEEQKAVIEAVDRLAGQAPAEWPTDMVPQLSKDKPIYLLRISADLRAFIRLTEAGQVELFDIVREATLRTFLERSRSKSGAR